MSTLSIQLQLQLAGGYINPETVTPDAFDLTVDGEFLRIAVELNTVSNTTLSPYHVTSPKLWFFLVTGDYNATVSFGAVDVLTLLPGLPNIVSSALTPVGRAVGGNTTLLYAAYK